MTSASRFGTISEDFNSNPATATCTWVIAPQSTVLVTYFMFDHLNLAAGSSFQITDVNGTSLVNLAGGGDLRLTPLVANSTVTVSYTGGSAASNGFQFTYYSFTTDVERSCSSDGPMVLQAREGIVETNYYTSQNPVTYNDRASCSWIISSPYGSKLRIFYARMYMEVNDYFAVSLGKKKTGGCEFENSEIFFYFFF